MELVNDFNTGAIELLTCGVQSVMTHKGTRFVNVSELVVVNPDTNKPEKVRVTLITEPVLFSKTAYPIREGRNFTTSALEQLESLEIVR